MVYRPLNPQGAAVFTGLKMGSGPINVPPSPLAAALLAGKQLSASHHLLASCIRLGERAQGARDAFAVAPAGRSMLELPLRQELAYAVPRGFVCGSAPGARPRSCVKQSPAPSACRGDEAPPDLIAAKW
jgi:hypothetical protein